MHDVEFLAQDKCRSADELFVTMGLLAISTVGMH